VYLTERAVTYVRALWLSADFSQPDYGPTDLVFDLNSNANLIEGVGPPLVLVNGSEVRVGAFILYPAQRYKFPTDDRRVEVVDEALKRKTFHAIQGDPDKVRTDRIKCHAGLLSSG
jgi:hypothetical protein